MRNKFFWIIDTLKGGAIANHLDDLNKIVVNYKDDRNKLEINKRLNKILNHAINTVPFYKSLHKESINEFPIIDKNKIRNNIDSFISNKYSLNDLMPAITSGSTGTPFKIYQDKGKKKRNLADTVYFAEKAGYKIGDKLFYFKIWSNNNKKNILQRIFQNIVPIDVLNLEEKSEAILKKLNKRQDSSISFLGYVSAFETICKTIEKKNIPINIKANSIITMSETLSHYTKSMMVKFFSCPVLSRYSNIENGILAQQTLDNENLFTINTASYYIEIFDLNSDRKVPFGQLGRIIVTDFFNFAMPMIRYDTGDLGTMEEVLINGYNRLVLSVVEGRKLDQIYDTQGNLVSSYIVYKNMWNYTEIDQYQFIQKDIKEYLFKICIRGTFQREKKLIEEFKGYLGKDANFKVEYVEEIPLLASGKRKKVVNDYYTSPSPKQKN